MPINLSVPEVEAHLRPRITVIGVGGAGGNAVNNMIESELEGVEFVVANTDAQAMVWGQAPVRKSDRWQPKNRLRKSSIIFRDQTWSSSPPVWAVVRERVPHR